MSKLDPAARADFLELIKDLCELVPDKNLEKLEKAVRKLLPPAVEAELALKLNQKPAAKGGVMLPERTHYLAQIPC